MTPVSNAPAAAGGSTTIVAAPPATAYSGMWIPGIGGADALETSPGHLGSNQGNHTTGRLEGIALPSPLKAGKTYSRMMFLPIGGTGNPITHCWMAVVDYLTGQVLGVTADYTPGGSFPDSNPKIMDFTAPVTPSVDTRVYLCLSITGSSAQRMINPQSSGNVEPFMAISSGIGQSAAPVAVGAIPGGYNPASRAGVAINGPYLAIGPA